MTVVFLVILAMGGVRCSQLSNRQYPTRHHSPLNNGTWEPLVPKRGQTVPREEPVPDNAAAENRIELRRLMVAEAKLLVENADPDSGFFTDDLENTFDKLKLNIDNWRARRGLAALVDIGRKKGAFLTAGNPFPGDIVLFHNQWDANNNGEVDDQFTGCGIVVSRDDDKFEAIVRTGHAARRVSVWPERSQERRVNGEVVNSFLRVPSRTDSPEVAYLAGQLYAGYLDIELLVQNSVE